MSDDLMKRSREWLQSCVNAATRSGTPEEADLEAFLLAHIDGEPARIAAAMEARLSEERDALKAQVTDLEFKWGEAVAALRALRAASKMLLGRFQRMHDNDVLREVNEVPTEAALDLAEAVLAKYPEVSVFGRAKKAEAEREAGK